MFPEGRALEFLIAGVIALIVVGPKDLPVLLRKLGQFMAKVRSMAAEFRASFDEMARQSELDELRKEVEAMRHAQLSDIATHAGAPEIAQSFEDLSQGLSDVGVHMTPTGYYDSKAQTETIEVAVAPKPKRARRTAASKTVPSKKVTAGKAAAKPPAAKPPAVGKVPAKAAATPKARSAAKAVAAKPRARKSAGAKS